MYYSYCLSGKTVNIMVYCDSSAFIDDPSVKVFAMYDKLALNPVARAFGLYQNRPTEEVNQFHMVEAKNIDIGSYYVKLSDVPQGPVYRILISREGQNFYAKVTDRIPKNNTLYVHLK